MRDLVTTLDAGRKKLQQVGLGAVSRSPLADANRKRPQEIFGELFCCLYQRCRRQAPGQRFAFRHRVYSLDVSTGVKGDQFRRFESTHPAPSARRR